MPLVRAVIVNHNTSLFSELALRSLAATSTTSSTVELRTTVLDNHSDDEHVGARERDCRRSQSFLDSSIRALSSANSSFECSPLGTSRGQQYQ